MQATLCDLSGLGVLVTRPVDQAEGLCQAIEAGGGRAIRLPAIAIEAMPDTAGAAALLASAYDFQRIIFISRNAATHGIPLLPEGFQPTPDVQLIAVGEATAQTLAARGIGPVALPERSDSEGLLALAELRQVNGLKILIVRGEGGRSMLADTLTARGARVDLAEVYRRVLPDVSAAAARVLEGWDNEVQAVTATSGEVLANLCRLLKQDPRLFDTPLVVVSQRNLDDAVRRGFNRVFNAGGASDEALVKTLCRLNPKTPTAG
ncbi:MAG: uroporphyrinogen-III synthase [Pseudomonadota bacterium]